MKNKKYIFGFLISIFFLWLSLKKIDMGELRAAFTDVNYFYFIPAILLTVLSYFIRAIRWRFLLRSIKTIDLGHLFSAVMIGTMANFIFPARLGEFVRAYVLGERTGLRKSAAFATIVVERIFDGLTILFFLAVILIFFTFPFPQWLQQAFYLSFALYLIALLGLILFSLFPQKFMGWIQIPIKIFPEKLREKIMHMVESFTHGLEIFKSRKDILISSLLSIVLWIPMGFLVYSMFFTIGINLSIPVAFFLLVMLCLGVMIPSAPGFIGIVQFVFVAGMALFDVPKPQALAYSFLYHISQYIPLVVVGFFFLFKEGLSLGQIGKSSASVQEEDAR